MKMHLGYALIGKITIGNKVFIGGGSIILPGVTIGDNSIIGAGSVVKHDIPSNVVAAGNPARVLFSMDEFLLRHKNKMADSPCFGEEYTIRRNVNKAMKDEMNIRMDRRIGYVV